VASGLGRVLRVIVGRVGNLQQQRRLETIFEGQRSPQRPCTRGTACRVGLEIGFSMVGINQQLSTKGEAVHGLSPRREAYSAWNTRLRPAARGRSFVPMTESARAQRDDSIPRC